MCVCVCVCVCTCVCVCVCVCVLKDVYYKHHRYTSKIDKNDAYVPVVCIYVAVLQRSNPFYRIQSHCTYMCAHIHIHKYVHIHIHTYTTQILMHVYHTLIWIYEERWPDRMRCQCDCPAVADGAG